MTNKNLYDLLEVSPNATQEEIKESYRLIVSMLHPDKFPQDSKQWVRASEKTQEVNEAYSILKNPDQRVQYDRELFRQSPDASPEQSQTFTSHTSHSASSPRASQPAPSPSTPQPEASVQPTQQDNSGDGCLFGFIGAGFLLAIFVNVVSGFAGEFGIWNYVFFTVMGLGFLLAAFFRRRKP